MRCCSRLTFLVLLLLSLAVFVPAEIDAASQRDLTLEEMVDRSDEIVVGRVARNESRWEGRVIVTVSTITVAETIKGNYKTQIDITQLGGTAVHPRTNIAMTMTASNQVAFLPEQEIVLFVARGKSGAYHLVGAQQGKFVVRTNEKTQVKEIGVGPKQIEVARTADGDRVDTRPITLGELRDRIVEQMRKSELQGAGR